MPLTFSIVVNTCDRAQPLRTLLYALERQSYPHFEVVVVLGPTRDHSAQVVAEFGGRVTLVPCPTFNLSVSRNIGIEVAQGDIVVFIDDDAIPCLTWLEQLAEVFQDPNVAGAGGRVNMVYPDHGHLQFWHGMVTPLGHTVDVRPSPDHPLPRYGIVWYPRLMGTNMAYRRTALIASGGFDERYAYLYEEPDLAVRMARLGYRIEPLTQGQVYHAPASSRNREIFTWNINWYAWMRGGLYFGLKNGRPDATLWQTTIGALHHVQDIIRRVVHARRQNKLTTEQMPDVRHQLLRGLFWGLTRGLGGKTHTRTQFEPSRRDFQPFITAESSHYPNLSPLPVLQQEPISPMTEPALRICLISSDYPPRNTEGVARLTAMMARGLAELGHEVHVLTEGRPDHVTCRDGVYIHEVKPLFNRYATYREQGYPEIATALCKSHCYHDHVQTLLTNHRIQVVDSAIWQMDGLVTAVSGEVPTVLRLVTGLRHASQFNTRPNPQATRLSKLEQLFIQQSTALVPISGAIRDSYQASYQLDFSQHRHQIIHAAIEPIPDEQVMPLDGQATATPIILFVGRLEQRKGIQTLFEAIPDVLTQVPQAEIWLAGKDNSQHDGFFAQHKLTYPDYFRQKYPAYQSQVKFLGYVPDEKLNDLYRACDLFVAPSLFESFGIILLEAMNQARPVISCNVGGPTEIVVPNGDDQTGLLIPPSNADALSDAINRLLAQPELRRSMGLNGRQRLVEQFSYRAMAARYAAFYRTLINR